MALSEFEKGILTSAGLVMRMHDHGVASRELLEQTGLSNADCSQMDEYDKENLRLIVASEDIELKGL